MSETLISFYVLLSGAAIVVGVSTFPPLTEGGTSWSTTAEETAQNQSEAELSFCQGNTAGVNCVCFSQVSGYIMASDQPQIPGYRYAEKTSLARSQATKSC